MSLPWSLLQTQKNSWKTRRGLVYSRPTARVVVDTTDSKSVAFTGVPVQVRPLVPNGSAVASEEFLDKL